MWPYQLPSYSGALSNSISLEHTVYLIRLRTGPGAETGVVSKEVQYEVEDLYRRQKRRVREAIKESEGKR